MSVVNGHKDLLKVLQDKTPLSLGQFLETVLYHPSYGYYSQSKVIGKQADFITAPHLCQVFGELIGIWCAQTWLNAGQPCPVQLIELGPGTGIMMKDILRATQAIPQFHKNLTVCLVETSPTLQQIQKNTLKEYDFITWYPTLQDIPLKFSIFVANEFFDALPIDQVIYKKDKWYERQISLEKNKSFEESCDFSLKAHFKETLLDFSNKPFLKYLLTEIYQQPHLEGKIHEYSPLTIQIWQTLIDHLKQAKGAALIIDYGDKCSPWIGQTLQAVYRHRKVPLFSYLGQGDITHHVDFYRLHLHAAQNHLWSSDSICQSEFLKNMGIEYRLEALSQNATAAQKADLYLSAARLCASYEMGKLFKVLSIASTPFSVPGFS